MQADAPGLSCNQPPPLVIQSNKYHLPYPHFVAALEQYEADGYAKMLERAAESSNTTDPASPSTALLNSTALNGTALNSTSGNDTLVPPAAPPADSSDSEPAGKVSLYIICYYNAFLLLVCVCAMLRVAGV